MQQFLIPFLVFDAIVTVVIVLFIMRRRAERQADTGAAPGLPPIVSLATVRALATFATEQHERIGAQVRSNWSGIPEQLPGVVKTLLDELEIEARAQDLPVDRESLKTMLATSLRKHGVGKGGVLGEAMKQVA